LHTVFPLLARNGKNIINLKTQMMHTADEFLAENRAISDIRLKAQFLYRKI